MLTVPQIRNIQRCLSKGTKLPDFVETVPVRCPPGGSPMLLQQEIDPAETQIFRCPAVIGGKPHDVSVLDRFSKTGKTYLKPKTLQTISDARVVGWDAVTDGGGRLFSPGLMATDADLKDQALKCDHGFRGFHLSHEADGWSITIAKQDRVETFTDPVLFVGSVEPGNYGSFVDRTLPRLLTLPEIDADFAAIIVPDRQHWTHDVFDYMGIEKPLFTAREVRNFRFDRLAIFAGHDNVGALTTADLARIEALSTGLANEEASTSPRLYVSRRFNSVASPAYRPLRNEIEVEQALSSLGFECFHPEMWRFPTQVSVFSRASIIVGASGSGMFNVCFAQSGAKVLALESVSGCEHQHARLFSSTDAEYGFVFGDIDSTASGPLRRRPWSVDVEQVLTTLGELCS